MQEIVYTPEVGHPCRIVVFEVFCFIKYNLAAEISLRTNPVKVLKRLYL
jgi:hypothetical protein